MHSASTSRASAKPDMAMGTVNHPRAFAPGSLTRLEEPLKDCCPDEQGDQALCE